MNEKVRAFNLLWNKPFNSVMRDKLKAKLMERGVEPTEENCFDYWMGYLKMYRDVRGEVHHVNPFKNRALMRAMGRDKYGRPARYVARKNKKKKRRPYRRNRK